MKPKHISCILLTAICLVMATRADAQTLLDRLKKQIENNLDEAPQDQSTPVPEPRPETPQPLPPPVESAPSPAVRGSLGIRVTSVTPDAAEIHQLAVTRGALITAIEKGSPADKARLPLGAAIVAIDGRRIDSPDQLINALRTVRPGRDVEITFYERDRLTRRTVRMPVGQTPGLMPEDSDIAPLAEPQPSTASPARRPSGSSPVPSLGEQLGNRGSRPLLGRIGQVLDNVIAPAQAIEPVPDEAPLTEARTAADDSEVILLRRQVEQLQRQVDALQKTVESLEKRLSADR